MKMTDLTIDEQIEYMQSIVATSLLPTHMPKAILASLERLKAIDAVQQEHGGEINNPRCPICIALAALDKKPIDPNKWAFDRGLESY
jgi:hypothetical protein